MFVVDLSRGTGSWRPPIRVALAGEDDVSVSVGDFQSSSDEDDPAQEREETKRLLYVALTRARDRLYLGSVLQDGRLQPGRGSLGEVIPATLLHQLVPVSGKDTERGLAAPSTREWRASSGLTHVFSLVRCPLEDADRPPAGRMTDDTQDADYARLPLAAAQPGRTSMATGSLAQRSSVASERLLGTLVHRLIQRVGLTFDSDSDNILEGLRQLVRPDEQPPDQNLDVVLARAVELYRNLTTRPEVRRLYEMGDAFHEVPFTFMQNGARSRGSIDCVIARLDGIDDERGLTILEFKTGLARSEHDEQVTVYKEALRQIFPGLRVTAVIVYPERLVVV